MLELVVGDGANTKYKTPSKLIKLMFMFWAFLGP